MPGRKRKCAPADLSEVACVDSVDRREVLDRRAIQVHFRKIFPAAQWTGALKGLAFFTYATNYLIGTENAVILDVEETRAIQQAEVGASRIMLDRVEERWGIKPEWIAAYSAYGSVANLAWLVKEKGIARTSQSSVNRNAPMARDHAKTSLGTARMIATSVQRARSWSSTTGPLQRYEPASTKTVAVAIEPPRKTARFAHENPCVAQTSPVDDTARFRQGRKRSMPPLQAASGRPPDYDRASKSGRISAYH